mmetsp:Transcript_76541/g.159246  ORF Transcript_76541/g.159246 Transcript_76541/m.159246 type:complete len:822 (+) Transcript_76541:1876-4341(+)
MSWSHGAHASSIRLAFQRGTAAMLLAEEIALHLVHQPSALRLFQDNIRLERNVRAALAHGAIRASTQDVLLAFAGGAQVASLAQSLVASGIAGALLTWANVEVRCQHARVFGSQETQLGGDVLTAIHLLALGIGISLCVFGRSEGVGAKVQVLGLQRLVHCLTNLLLIEDVGFHGEAIVHQVRVVVEERLLLEPILLNEVGVSEGGRHLLGEGEDGLDGLGGPHREGKVGAQVALAHGAIVPLVDIQEALLHGCSLLNLTTFLLEQLLEEAEQTVEDHHDFLADGPDDFLDHLEAEHHVLRSCHDGRKGQSVTLLEVPQKGDGILFGGHVIETTRVVHAHLSTIVVDSGCLDVGHSISSSPLQEARERGKAILILPDVWNLGGACLAGANGSLRVGSEAKEVVAIAEQAVITWRSRMRRHGLAVPDIVPPSHWVGIGLGVAKELGRQRQSLLVHRESHGSKGRQGDPLHRAKSQTIAQRLFVHVVHDTDLLDLTHLNSLLHCDVESVDLADTPSVREQCVVQALLAQVSPATGEEVELAGLVRFLDVVLAAIIESDTNGLTQFTPERGVTSIDHVQLDGAQIAECRQVDHPFDNEVFVGKGCVWVCSHVVFGGRSIDHLVEGCCCGRAVLSCQACHFEDGKHTRVLALGAPQSSHSGVLDTGLEEVLDNGLGVGLLAVGRPLDHRPKLCANRGHGVPSTELKSRSVGSGHSSGCIVCTAKSEDGRRVLALECHTASQVVVVVLLALGEALELRKIAILDLHGRSRRGLALASEPHAHSEGASRIELLVDGLLAIGQRTDAHAVLVPRPITQADGVFAGESL